MNSIFYLLVLLIFILMLTSCMTNEKSEKLLQERLEYDSAVLTDSTRSVISGIDGSEIDAFLLEEKIRSLMDSAKVTGLAIAILNDNQIVFRKAFGYANQRKKTSLQINHSFYGASFSKAVFGYIVTILADEGVIDLDKPLQQYLEFPLYALKPEHKWRGFQDLENDKRYEKITARMCLTHTAGFQNWRWIPRPNDPENREKLKIYFDPGTQYFYSGEGIMLLQYVIEHITGKGIEELAKEKVFDPLQMRNTSYVWQKKFESKYCQGHTENQNVIKKNRRDEAQAAGSMETNLIDYSVFVKHIMQLYKQGSGITKMMLNPSFRIRTKAQFGPLSLEQSDENDDIQLSYGLGWGLLQSPHGPGAFKEGHDDGFQHYSIIFPDKGTGVVILSNSDNAESIFKETLEIAIADIYTPWQWENYIPYQMKRE
ncbi:serine hydrolase domain-containing protein [Negadavirga shengliensis]|uniref:Serine hydrolase domain-containing protein n=1 Tax=Negadavirga shengliensis TaxID=1389218 RepID=A0ABV9SWH0_9BACT